MTTKTPLSTKTASKPKTAMMKKRKAPSRKKPNEHKQALITLSVKAREIKQVMIDKARTADEKLAASTITINAILIGIYQKRENCTTFKKFDDWQDEGFSVKRNEKAFRVWAAPRRAKDTTEATNVSTGEVISIEDEYKYWGMCCLFHEHQVEPLQRSTGEDA